MPPAASLSTDPLHAPHGGGVFATLASLWRRLVRRLTGRRSHHRQGRGYRSGSVYRNGGQLPTYLPVHPHPAIAPMLGPPEWVRRTVAPEQGPPRPTQLQSLELALRLGRGFGSVRTSVLVAAAEQLRREAEAGPLSPDVARLQEMIGRQIVRRQQRRRRGQ